MTRKALLEVRNLRTRFKTVDGAAMVVDGVSFSIAPGETLGIVGESGSGKSMTALSIIGLVPRPAGRIIGGEVLFEGEDLLKKSRQDMQRIRGRSISMIPQDPTTSLNPVFTIGDQIMETLRIDRIHADLRRRAGELLRGVQIPAPEQRLQAFPHQMSGGMRQRVVSAIGMARDPKLLIADEATTSLDPTIQQQFLKLLKDIQERTGVAMIVITHDFGVVAAICDRVAVMYAGRIVESADVKTLFAEPAHPYSDGLIRSIIHMGEGDDGLFTIGGQPPQLDRLPEGCHFAPRCPLADDRCRVQYPPVFVGPTGQTAACWRLEDRWEVA